VLSLGLGITASQQLRGTPASLFASGENGVLDDPSDLSTRFQDSAGTTPVTSDSDPVGLALEKHKGLVLGFERYTDDDAKWNLDTGVTVDNGVIEFTGAQGFSANSYQDASTAVDQGKTYLVEIEVLTRSQGSISIRIGALGVSDFTGADAPGVYTSRLTCIFAGKDDVVQLFGRSSFIGTARVISVRELPGNHFTQSSTSFRPLSKGTYDQYDGSDDRMAGVYPPTAAGTIIARFNGATGGRVIYGSHDGSNGRCYLGLDSSGRLAAGIGAQGTSTIVAGSDLRNEWHTGAVIWDGTTVKLYLDGAEIYSAAQSGSVNTTVPIYRGCINNNGTPAAFWDGGIGESLIIDRALTADEILKTTNKWST